MRGHVRKRSGGWAFVVDVGRLPAQRCKECRRRVWLERERPSTTCTECDAPMGEVALERRQVWRSGFENRKAAEAELRQYLHRVETGGDPFPEEMTYREYSARWLEHERNNLRPRTFAWYSQVTRDHILPLLGELRLDRIRPAHVAAVLDAMAARELSARSQVGARAVLSSSLRRAMAWGLIPTNPVAAVRPPKIERPELAVPTSAQIVAIINAAKASPWEVPILLSATTGARRAEVLGVRWADVDLDARRLRIMRTVQRVRGTDGEPSSLQFVEPKTDRARREISLPVIAVERLRRHRTEQAARRLELGPAWVDHGLVSERGDGRPLDPDDYSGAFKRLAKAAGMPPAMRLHDLRHGVATALLEQGVHPAIASAVLGHSSPAFTMSTYQHVLDGMTDRAAAALDEAFGTGTDG